MMGLDCTLSIKSSTLIGSLIILALLAQPGWAGVNSCWGGCLNQCVLLVGKKVDDKIPCYWDCLAKCFPQPGQVYARPMGHNKIQLDSTSYSSPASEIPRPSVPNGPRNDVGSKSEFDGFRLGIKYYCIIGCSLQSCMLPNRGSTDLKTCLVRCANRCSR